MGQIRLNIHITHKVLFNTIAHLTNMIFEVTPSNWFRTFWTSMEPIHCRDPTKDGSLSPTSTRAFVETTTAIEDKWIEHLDCIIASLHSEPNRYLLDLPVSGDGSLHVALLLEPGTDGLKGSVSTAPAVVVKVVLHVVVVTVDSSNQVHLEEPHICRLSKTVYQSYKRDIRGRALYICVWLSLQCVVPFLGPERDVWGPGEGFGGNHPCKSR